MVLLQIEDASKTFGGLRAVDKVSFSVAKGEILGLIGPHGAGKTTMFNLITGWQAPDFGTVTFDGQALTGLASFEFAKRGLVRTFQGTKIFRNLTVRQNLIIARHAKTRAGLPQVVLRWRWANRERASQHVYVQDLMNFVGIADKADLLAENLAYAHQSLLGIAMALALEPKMLLLDEPFAGMNATETQHMINLIRSIQGRGVTILIIEHNIRAVMALCHRIIVMDSGKKIAEGTPEQIRSDRKVIDIYLGRRGTDARAKANNHALR